MLPMMQLAWRSLQRLARLHQQVCCLAQPLTVMLLQGHLHLSKWAQQPCRPLCQTAP